MFKTRAILASCIRNFWPIQHLDYLSVTAIAHAESGMLHITTDPGDAQIFINGQRKGNSPSLEGQSFAVKLPQGEYTAEARKSDGKDYYGKKSVGVTGCI